MATAGRAGKRRALRESSIERLCAGDAVFMFRVESALFGADSYVANTYVPGASPSTTAAWGCLPATAGTVRLPECDAIHDCQCGHHDPRRMGVVSIHRSGSMYLSRGRCCATRYSAR